MNLGKVNEYQLLLVIIALTMASCNGDSSSGGSGQPLVALDGSLTLDRNGSANETLDSDNPNQSALTYSIVINGAKGVATIIDPATGDYQYDSNLNATGVDSFSFKVSDGSTDSNTATVSVTINDTPVLVFLTSTGYQGNFGGLAGGDANCTALANGAGLAGPWVAWLSDTSTDARDRVHNGGPYQNVADNSKIADDLTDLTDGSLDSTILNLSGGTEGTSVWTGTYPDGTINPVSHCSDWTSTTGSGNYGTADFTNTNWTQSGGVICDGARRLYCLQ